MAHRFTNYFLEKQINKLRPRVHACLQQALEQSNKVLEQAVQGDIATRVVPEETINIIKQNVALTRSRMSVERHYVLLKDYYRHDAKRRQMVNANFLTFLQAVLNLYTAAPVLALSSVTEGQPANPMLQEQLKNAVIKVQNSFLDVLESVGIDARSTETLTEVANELRELLAPLLGMAGSLELFRENPSDIKQGDLNTLADASRKLLARVQRLQKSVSNA